VRAAAGQAPSDHLYWGKLAQAYRKGHRRLHRRNARARLHRGSTELRGAGQGFGYNIGGGIGALGPAAIGVAAAQVGLSDARALAATSYGLSLVALLFLPETRGKPLTG
jgi:hypothetical protein